MLERPPSADASKREQRRARQRKFRQRQLDGHLSITLVVTPAETDKLRRLEYLHEDELENRKRVAEAVRRLLTRIVIDPDA